MNSLAVKIHVHGINYHEVQAPSREKYKKMDFAVFGSNLPTEGFPQTPFVKRIFLRDVFLR